MAIITGAPLDYTAFEDVSYWDEICKIMEWSKTHVHCTLHMCWGVYAGLHYHYGINKIDLPEKLSGIYKHYVLKKNSRCSVALMMYLWHLSPGL